MIMSDAWNKEALYETRALAANSIVPSSRLTLRTNGLVTVGDGSDAIYGRWTGFTPGGFQSLDGAWWKLENTQGVASGGSQSRENAWFEFATESVGVSFDTRAIAAASWVHLNKNTLRTHGLSVAGDGGGQLYVRNGASSSGAFQSADGAWWKPVPQDGVVNLSQFGAVADSNGTTGSGVDNRTALQAAIDSLPNGGIIRGSGWKTAYRLTDYIHVSASNIFLEDMWLFFDATAFTSFVAAHPSCLVVGASNFALVGMAGGTTINYNGTMIENFVMDRVKITSVSTKTTGYTARPNHKGPFFNGVKNVRQQNCYISGFAAEVNDAFGCDELWFLNNTIEDCSFNVLGTGSCRAVHFIDNNINNVGQIGEFSGCWFEYVNNVAFNCGFSADPSQLSGILVAPSSFLEPMKIRIAGNMFYSDPAYDGVLGACIKVSGSSVYMHELEINGNIIAGGWSIGVGILSPPRPLGGTQRIQNNIIRRESTQATSQAILVGWSSAGTDVSQVTEINNNTIIHVTGTDVVTMDLLGGQGAVNLPRVQVSNNKIVIPTGITLSGQSDTDHFKLGKVIYCGYNSAPKQRVTSNFLNDTEIGAHKVYSSGAITNATTAGKAKTVAVITFTYDGMFVTKAATDNFWDLTALTTAAGQYKAVSLCINQDGAAGTVEGDIATTAASARVPNLVPIGWTPVGLVILPPSYAGGSLAGFTFGNIVG